MKTEKTAFFVLLAVLVLSGCQFAPTVDKDALKTAIAEANAAKSGVQTSVDGTDISSALYWVTAEQLVAFNNAITAAQTIADDANAIQTVVDSTKTTLIETTNTFNSQKQPGKKTGTDSNTVTWTLAETSSIFTGHINSVARGAANFAAVGADGKIAWSANGTTWTAAAIDSGITTGGLYDIAYGNNTFIAAGGTFASLCTILISTDDGKNWSQLSAPTGFPNTYIASIAYGEPGGVPTFVAGSCNGAIAYAVKDSGVWTWTVAAWAGGSSIFTSISGDNVSASVESIVFGNGTFIAAGEKGRMASSANGKNNWNRIINSFEDYAASTISGMAYNGNGLYIAVESGQSYGKIASSTNGSTWTQIDNGPFGISYNDGAYDIAYGNGKFVAAGYGGKIAYTTDGSGWTTVGDSKFGTKIIRGITYGNNKWIAVGDSGTIAVGTGL